MVGIKRRQLPQALLPPHRTDQKARRPLRQVAEAPLPWHRQGDIVGDHQAGDQEGPESAGHPARLRHKADNVGDRVGVHWRARQLRATAAITVSEASAPSASPFSKSPELTAIWLVTWARQSTGLLRARAKA